MITIRKFGRKPRKFDPKIKKFASFKSALDLAVLPTPPEVCDWTKGITEFGMMLNDQLGCCTISAVYHARQIWTANASKEDTEPDKEVLKLYELACGYNPRRPDSDQGGVEQDVLKYLLKHGMPLDSFFPKTDKILGFVEVPVSNIPEIKTTVYEFGLAYIGFNVPSNIFDSENNPLPIWKYDPSAQIEGGHAVIVVGYDSEYCTVISWGELYKMTWEFFEKQTDEAYAIVDPAWITSQGKSPLGLTTAQLSTIMSELK